MTAPRGSASDRRSITEILSRYAHQAEWPSALDPGR
jgi:hypothetical protein